MRAWSTLLSLRLRALLATPGDLAAGLVGDLVVAGSGVLVIAALFARVPSVGGFSAAEILVAWGLAQAALGVAQTLFAGLFVLNRRYLLGGDLDRVLLRPLDPYGQIMAEHLDPGGLLRAALGLGVVAWAAPSGAFDLSVAVGAAAATGAIAAWTLGGALLIAGVLTATASIGFRIRHEGSAVGLVAQFQGLAHVPLPVLPVPFAAIALTVAPFALTGFVPAMALCGRPGWTALAAAQPVIGLVAFAFGRLVFARGLARHGA